MKPIPIICSLALSAVALAACGGAGTFGSVHDYDRVDTTIDYAIGGRDLHTQIVGNPFAGDKAAFDRRVTAILTARNTRQPTNFTTEPGPSARLQYRLVLVFNEAPRLIDIDLCREAPPLGTGPMGSGRLTVHAALCSGTFALRGIRGSLGDAAGPDDPRFEQFLAQTGYLLLAANNWQLHAKE